jgi:hypothetical protein
MKILKINYLFSLLLVGSVITSINKTKSQIIPTDRLYDWESNVGVPGGIPNRTTIGAIVDSVIYGAGNVDASSAIETAIDLCPEGQVVYIPSGTYRLDNRIYRAYAHNITIRGAGIGITILKAGASVSQMLLLGTADWPRPTSGIAITGGATAGNNVVTVSNTSSIIVGKLVRIEQNDLPYVIDVSTPTTNDKLLSATFRVVSKTATTVTLTPQIPFTFTESPMLVQYSISPLVNTGVEDLTIDCNAQSGVGIEIDQAWGCWIKNVEIKNSTNRQMFLYCFVSGEIRHNYTHSVTSGGPNHEGIDLYEDCSFNLIEDNITYNGGFPGIILGDSRGGCAGNVIAYNFSYYANTGSPDMAGMDISVSHGPHNLMNLVEGNIAGGMGSDGYFGSTSHITVVRNWFTATHPTCTDNLIAVNIGRWNNYFNLVGNILGTSGFSSNGLYQPEIPFSYSDEVIYKLGFPNMGNNGFTGTWGPTTPPSYIGQFATGNGLQELDFNVKNSMIRHGNYDYKNNSIIWDPSITDHNIPASYFRSTKPEYFCDLQWPPFEPSTPPGVYNDENLSRIPAGYRFVYGYDPCNITEVILSDQIPEHFALDQNYPNPFNPTTTIRYSIPNVIASETKQSQQITLIIYDVLGNEVATLVDEEKYPGFYEVEFDGTGLSSSVYIYQLITGNYIQTRKMVILK